MKVGLKVFGLHLSAELGAQTEKQWQSDVNRAWLAEGTFSDLVHLAYGHDVDRERILTDLFQPVSYQASQARLRTLSNRLKVAASDADEAHIWPSILTS